MTFSAEPAPIRDLEPMNEQRFQTELLYSARDVEMLIAEELSKVGEALAAGDQLAGRVLSAFAHGELAHLAREYAAARDAMSPEDDA